MMSKWIVETISLAYESLDYLPIWLSEPTLQEVWLQVRLYCQEFGVCDVTGWSSPHTFVSFLLPGHQGLRCSCLSAFFMISNYTKNCHYGGVGIDVPTALIDTA